MIALLLAAAIGQVEPDAAELRERWQIAESVYSKSCRERYEAIQREPNEARKRELSSPNALWRGQRLVANTFAPSNRPHMSSV